MRLHHPLDDILRGRGTLHVLRTLSLSPEADFTTTELAKLGKLALSHVQSAVAILESHGLIDRSVHGRTSGWRIARENALLPALQALFAAERKLPSELEVLLREALPPRRVKRAVIFGSVVRGEETGWSDVDLFLEVRGERSLEEVREAVYRAGSRIRRRYGLNLSSLVLTPTESQSRLSRSFRDTLEREGKPIPVVP